MIFDIIIIVILCLVLIALLILIFKNNKSSMIDDDLKKIKKLLDESSNSSEIKIYYGEIKERIDKINLLINKIQLEIINKLGLEFKDINKLLIDNDDKSNRILKETLENIRKDNSEKLDKIKDLIDENLKKTLEDRLNKSFNSVFEQINNLNKSIGEIRNIAGDVSSLKNVLANVKVKGIVGEVILGNLIKEILIEGQYEENFSAKVGSKEFVEYAIKMPGNDGEFVYLPVDSKFPTEAYNKLQEALSSSNKELVIECRKELKKAIVKFADDISSKYINEPRTTGFAIMFLPIEGLYAEVINLGLFEEIQNKYKVVISGPSTFAALLNALQMGFKTLVIQKKSAEVFELLVAVKSEFSKFADALEKTQKKFNEASNNLDDLVGTRTRVMTRTLNKIEELPDVDSSKYFDNK